jgi:hypothetical protein
VVSERLSALLDELADELAERVCVRLAGQLPAAAAGEPWRLLTLAEAAGRLGRSTRWVRERVKTGELASVRLDGGAFAFLPDDLEAFAGSRRVAAGEPAERRLVPVERGWEETG